MSNDGKILGRKVETLGNVGAYLSHMASGGPTVNTINFGTGTYKIDNYEAISRVVVTNTVPVDAYRGYGPAEGAILPSARSMLWHATSSSTRSRCGGGISFSGGISLSALRHLGRHVRQRKLPGTADKALAAFDYEGRRSECQALRGSGIYRGIGVAAYTHMPGWHHHRLAMSGFDRGGWESARVSIDSILGGQSGGSAPFKSADLGEQSHVCYRQWMALGLPQTLHSQRSVCKTYFGGAPHFLHPIPSWGNWPSLFGLRRLFGRPIPSPEVPASFFAATQCLFRVEHSLRHPAKSEAIRSGEPAIDRQPAGVRYWADNPEVDHKEIPAGLHYLPVSERY